MKSVKSKKARAPSVASKKSLTPIKTSSTRDVLLDFKTSLKSPIFLNQTSNKSLRTKSPTYARRISPSKKVSNMEKLSQMSRSSKTPVKKVMISGADHDLKSILKKTPLKSSVGIKDLGAP